MTREEMIARIDLIADTHRQLILGDITRAFEYQVAEAQAKEFAARQYLGELPVMVSAWSQAKVISGKEACDDILMQATKYHESLAYIRATRLLGKERLKTCKEADCDGIYQETIQKIKTIV